MKLIYILLSVLMLAGCAHNSKPVSGKIFCGEVGVVPFDKDPKIEGSWVELYLPDGHHVKLNNCFAILYNETQQ